MPVNITNEELDIFNKNGFSDDDVRATVENYRSQGLDDNAIRAKIDTRLQGWNTPQKQTTQNAPQPLKVDNNYQADIDDAAREAAAEFGGILPKDYHGNRGFDTDIAETSQSLQTDNNYTPEGNLQKPLEGQVTINQPYISADNGLRDKFSKYTKRLNPVEVWKEIKNNPNFLDEQKRMSAGKRLKDIYTFESNHPLLADIAKNYLPGYRSLKQGLEFDRTHGTLGTLKEQAGNLATQNALNLIPATNIASAALTPELKLAAPLTAGIDGTILGLTSAAGDMYQEGAPASELITRPLGYGLGGMALGYGGKLLGNGFKYIKNLDRRIDLAKRRNLPLYERMSDEQLARNTVPASQYGVNEINSARNEAIAKQIEGNINAETQLLKEYNQLHSEMVNKYGSIENLKNQAVKEFETSSKPFK